MRRISALRLAAMYSACSAEALSVASPACTVEPFRRTFQIPSAQHEAAISARAVPFKCSDEESGVLFDRVEVGIDCLKQALETRREFSLYGEVHPVERRQGRRHGCRVGLACDDRHDPFVVGDGMTEFELADVGSNRVWADHEHEGVRALDTRKYFFQPVGRRRDVVEVDPGLAPLIAQRIVRVRTNGYQPGRTTRNVGHPGLRRKGQVIREACGRRACYKTRLRVRPPVRRPYTANSTSAVRAAWRSPSCSSHHRHWQ